MAIFHQLRGARRQAAVEKRLAGGVVERPRDIPQKVSDGAIPEVPRAAVRTGAQLLAWLGRRDMSISGFAEATGLTRKTVSKYLDADELPRLVTLAVRGLEV